MVLIGGAALAFVPIRLILRTYAEFPQHATIAENPVLGWGMFAHFVLVPLALASSAALWLLRMRKPRPVLRRIFRQPGMIACTAALSYLIILLIGLVVYILLDFGFGRNTLVLNTWDDRALLLELFAIPPGWMGTAVAVGWITLCLSGSWRSEPSWIDRAGRGLGIYWVTSTLLFGWALSLF
jgi:hypothetical protein